jgi:hypothetical protein
VVSYWELEPLGSEWLFATKVQEETVIRGKQRRRKVTRSNCHVLAAGTGIIAAKTLEQTPCFKHVVP